MTRPALIALGLALAGSGLLTACNGQKTAEGSNVTLRDMEVVDGTANDSMTDLDNATTDGTPLDNAVGPAAPATAAAVTTNAVSPTIGNAAAPAPAKAPPKPDKPAPTPVAVKNAAPDQRNRDTR